MVTRRMLGIGEGIFISEVQDSPEIVERDLSQRTRR
jgi:hypothetical protein